ncbi:hypothetical protein [Endozoicomonas sp. ALB091]|uniref:hypothetical protein n=1 Tax=Endozoicomonas sp. ALB091 TaxID=3403073 RepID=UPI003BB62CFB
MPSAQGFILKAPTSTDFYPKSAARADRQTGSGRMPDCSTNTFNGKRISSHRCHRSTASTMGEARRIENAFWKKTPLHGRQITSADVLRAYGNDTTSLRGGFFLQRLCLQNILHNNRKVTPDQVIQEFNREPGRNNKCQLAIARFKAECCLRNLTLNGQPVRTDTVVRDFPDGPEGKLGVAHFKEQCCLKSLTLNGQQVTAAAVIEDFPDSPEGRLGLARFKAECCLKGLAVNSQLLTPDAVVKSCQAAKATLELARFKEECCLKGLLLNGHQITPDTVIESFPDDPEGRLGIMRFKEQCCLSGLLLNGQQVTPDTVVKGCLEINATLPLARFKAECCLKGLALNGHQVTPGAVVKAYQAARATLELARFKAECCLKSLPLNGQRVTPDTVVRDFQAARAPLALARFKQQCCLRGLTLGGRQVTADEVVMEFPDSPDGQLATVRFKAECCLRGLPLNGRQVTPEAVIRDYESGNWLLERAIFYSLLALNARKLHGNYLDNRQVLAAFDAAPGDHSSGQTRYLIKKLRQSHKCDETSEAQDIMQKAWQILNSVPVKDEQQRLQCILKFIAMQNELTIDHQRVSAQQVSQSIKTLKRSFQNARLHFFFLAYCYVRGQPVDGRQIHRHQVLECLQNFHKRSNWQHALGRWFEQYSPEANIMDNLLFERTNTVAVSVASPGKECQRPYQVREYRDETENTCATRAVTASAAQTMEPPLTTGGSDVPDKSTRQLTPLTLKVLEIIQEINGSYNDPAILITGSYARFLQNLCSVFNDIDIICTTEKSTRTLLAKLQALNTDRDSDIPKSIIISPVPGCPAIQLPGAYNIDLEDGDLATRALGFQVSVDARVAQNTTGLAVEVPGVARPVWCLSFAEETRLLNDTLEYLAENLDPLTEQLQNGPVFDVPRTLLFNSPQNTDERIYGLLLRCLLTLNKARQFIALHSEGRSGTNDGSATTLEQQRLHALTEHLQMKLTGHVCRHDFEQRVNGWLSTAPQVNGYQIKRKAFITTLLEMMHPEEDRINSAR